MKISSIFPAIVGIAFLISPAAATTLYVDQNSTNPVPPFASWNTAANNIQVAINASAVGDTILVTNGIYSTGGLAMLGTLTNRVTLNKPITVQSVNGPLVTIIQGASSIIGSTAVRCAWLTNGATLNGFTLQNGVTTNSGPYIDNLRGGGVWCSSSSNSLVSNCIIKGNLAYGSGGGGGAYQGFYKNCLLTANWAPPGGNTGGAYNTVMNNCTVVYNSGYGVNQGSFTNCIIYSNTSLNGEGSGKFSYCCTPSASGVGCITSDPQLFADGVRMLPGSPCIGAGTNLSGGSDFFGRPWANPPSMGCAEFQAGTLVAKPVFQFTGNSIGFTVGDAAIVSQGPFSYSWLKDGVPLSDNEHFSSTQTTNLVAATLSLSDAGNYQLIVSNAFGVVTSQTAQMVIHCVDAAGTNPVPPYLTWTTAATNIQDAINIAIPSDVVLVTNGVYSRGGISMDGVITNCISVNRGILVQSVNGPNTTIIHGAWDPVSTNGLGAIRCAWLTNGAILSGFTLTGGATRNGSSSAANDGGGIYCASTNVFVRNCLIFTNYSYYAGGGVFASSIGNNAKATLIHCTLAGNHSTGSPSHANDGSGEGGGAYACNLNACLLTANTAENLTGGGAEKCYATNCAFTGNFAYSDASAAHACTLVNCTVTKNFPAGQSSSSVVSSSTLLNSIAIGNIRASALFSESNYAGNCTLTYCCADPLPAGIGNIDVDPQLMDDGVHLAASSPCTGAGLTNVDLGTDYDGQTWNTPPSIGCDEWHPELVIGTLPAVKVNTPAHGMTVSMVAVGQSLHFTWILNGIPIHDDAHFTNSGTDSLVVNHFGPEHAGIYQVVVTNAYGALTSQVATVVMHAVNAAGLNPVPPYSSWANAATNIQDAINAAAAGDLVLVTNGIYSTGGMAMAGDLTNRVALNKPVTVMSANGYSATVIQGAWDAVSTNGPGAVRCAYVGDGATLTGFTLQNGATRATGDASEGGPLESGGGVWCSPSNGIVVNCLLSNNCAIYGGGIASGSLQGSFVTGNIATLKGGAAFGADLINCTLENNYLMTSAHNGAGTYNCDVVNCIVLGNYDNYPIGIGVAQDNYSSTYGPNTVNYVFSCTSPTQFSGSGDIYSNPQFLDGFHIAASSPCLGKGLSYLNYVSYVTSIDGNDMDGELWSNPPSMGCDEVIPANLIGSLSASVISYQTIGLQNHPAGFLGTFTGRAAGFSWDFGDGQTSTNTFVAISHAWMNSGDYPVTFTIYNNDNPGGVSASTMLHVLTLNIPQLQSALLLTNGFQFQFAGQTNASYVIQYTTNLVPPVVWSTLKNIFQSTEGLQQITDSNAPTGTRFYRVQAQ